MKTMLFCAAVGALFAVSAVSASCHAATLPQTYCEGFADRWYNEAVAIGSETPDGVYEQAMADCELQAYALSLIPAPAHESDYPTGEDLLGSAVNVMGMSYHEALDAADAQGRYGVVRVSADGWLPTTAAEDAAADRDALESECAQ